MTQPNHSEILSLDLLRASRRHELTRIVHELVAALEGKSKSDLAEKLADVDFETPEGLFAVGEVLALFKSRVKTYEQAYRVVKRAAFPGGYLFEEAQASPKLGIIVGAVEKLREGRAQFKENIAKSEYVMSLLAGRDVDELIQEATTLIQVIQAEQPDILQDPDFLTKLDDIDMSTELAPVQNVDSKDPKSRVWDVALRLRYLLIILAALGALYHIVQNQEPVRADDRNPVVSNWNPNQEINAEEQHILEVHQSLKTLVSAVEDLNLSFEIHTRLLQASGAADQLGRAVGQPAERASAQEVEVTEYEEGQIIRHHPEVMAYTNDSLNTEHGLIGANKLLRVVSVLEIDGQQILQVRYTVNGVNQECWINAADLNPEVVSDNDSPELIQVTGKVLIRTPLLEAADSTRRTGTMLAQNAEITIIGMTENEGATFYNIIFEGTTGWVSANKVSVEEEITPSTFANSSPPERENAPKVFVHSNEVAAITSVEGTILVRSPLFTDRTGQTRSGTMLDKGSTVTITGAHGDGDVEFYYVTTEVGGESTSGWVAAGRVSTEEDISPDTFPEVVKNEEIETESGELIRTSTGGPEDVYFLDEFALIGNEKANLIAAMLPNGQDVPADGMAGKLGLNEDGELYGLGGVFEYTPGTPFANQLEGHIESVRVAERNGGKAQIAMFVVENDDSILVTGLGVEIIEPFTVNDMFWPAGSFIYDNDEYSHYTQPFPPNKLPEGMVSNKVEILTVTPSLLSDLEAANMSVYGVPSELPPLGSRVSVVTGFYANGDGKIISIALRGYRYDFVNLEGNSRQNFFVREAPSTGAPGEGTYTSVNFVSSDLKDSDEVKAAIADASEELGITISVQPTPEGALSTANGWQLVYDAEGEIGWAHNSAVQPEIQITATAPAVPSAADGSGIGEGGGGGGSGEGGEPIDTSEFITYDENLNTYIATCKMTGDIIEKEVDLGGGVTGHYFRKCVFPNGTEAELVLYMTKGNKVGDSYESYFLYSLGGSRLVRNETMALNAIRGLSRDGQVPFLVENQEIAVFLGSEDIQGHATQFEAATFLGDSIGDIVSPEALQDFEETGEPPRYIVPVYIDF